MCRVVLGGCTRLHCDWPGDHAAVAVLASAGWQPKGCVLCMARRRAAEWLFACGACLRALVALLGGCGAANRCVMH
eukprot:5269208-Alexandrium_andersonii.AAC.1